MIQRKEFFHTKKNHLILAAVFSSGSYSLHWNIQIHIPIINDKIFPWGCDCYGIYPGLFKEWVDGGGGWLPDLGQKLLNLLLKMQERPHLELCLIFFQFQICTFYLTSLLAQEGRRQPLYFVCLWGLVYSGQVIFAILEYTMLFSFDSDAFS